MKPPNLSRSERWDSVVADWLCELAVIEPDPISVRPVRQPRGLVIASSRGLRQRTQLQYTQAGFRVRTVSCWQDAFELLARSQWDVVLIESEVWEEIQRQQVDWRSFADIVELQVLPSP